MSKLTLIKLISIWCIMIMKKPIQGSLIMGSTVLHLYQAQIRTGLTPLVN